MTHIIWYKKHVFLPLKKDLYRYYKKLKKKFYCSENEFERDIN